MMAVALSHLRFFKKVHPSNIELTFTPHIVNIKKLRLC